MSVVTAKLVVTGPMGAGKTTAIRAISSIAPILTEVANLDWDQCAKEETTVGMDYGELELPCGGRLAIYGTPGQGRFEHMWRILGADALGVLILIDNTRARPLDDLRCYLESFAELTRTGRAVIVVGRLEQCAEPGLDDYIDWLADHGYLLPVLAGDVRRREEVVGAVEVLLHAIEVHGGAHIGA